MEQVALLGQPLGRGFAQLAGDDLASERRELTEADHGRDFEAGARQRPAVDPLGPGRMARDRPSMTAVTESPETTECFRYKDSIAMAWS
jgi:hypothetical protein